MNKSLLLSLLVIFTLALAACGGEDATPTPEREPTEEPPEIPASMTPTATAALQAETVNADQLVNVEWQWADLVEPEPAAQSVVPAPENFTLVFLADGSVSVKADCNMVGGTYALDRESLTIQLGPSTMAFCGEESLDQQYLALLGSVGSASLEDDRLMLGLQENAGRMGFNNGGAPEAPVSGGGLTPKALANMAYTNEFTQSGLAPLEDGEYSEPAAPGSATQTKVMLTEHVGFGELDGQAAAAVILVTDPGGSGTFYTLHAVVEQDGQPVNVATAQLGDRAQINSLAIEDNQIVVDMITHGPDDPMCCPTQRVVDSYELQGGQLIETSSEVVAGADAAITGEELALLNVKWQWEQTVTPVDTTIVDDPSKYTVTLLPGGEYQFTADCNSGSGSFSFLDTSSITLEPGIMTMAECGPDSLSDQFLKDLGAAAITFFQDGKLYIDLQYDSGTMRFGEALGIAPEQINLSIGDLPYSWQAVVVEATPYDESQPPGPKGLPEHIEILFGVTDPADREPDSPVMYIIPVDAYQRLWVSSESEAVTRMMDDIFAKTVLPPTDLQRGLPALPYEEIAGANDLAVQVGRALPANELNETSSAEDGYRFVGRWAQDANPVTDEGLRYVYQGFTNDGRYLVSFWWPVTSSELPDDAAGVPADEMQKVTDDPEGYLEAKAEELNALPASAWEPDLDTLDKVVASLEIETMRVSGLTDKVWWWMGSTAGSGSDEFTPVDDPSLYQAQYTSDDAGPATGGIQYIADCNSGNMPYELRNGGSVGGMLAQPGPMTLAECGPQSRYQEFAAGLQASQDYRVQPNGKSMMLVMPADGPRLLFADSGRTVPETGGAGARPTPVPEATVPPSTPTPTPLPTTTPTAEVSFKADNTSIQQGACTTVRWKVENVKTVHVYPQGESYDKYPVTGEGSQEVCPETSTTYELRAELQTGEILLQQVTVKVEPQTSQDPLKNTSWQLSSMYVNQIPVPDTSITLVFGADGDLSGNASCNSYNGTYTINANLLSVGPLATTRKACGEAVDAQEQAYLTALQAAATFEVSGNQLIIFDTGGSEVLRLNAAS